MSKLIDVEEFLEHFIGLLSVFTANNWKKKVF